MNNLADQKPVAYRALSILFFIVALLLYYFEQPEAAESLMTLSILSAVIQLIKGYMHSLAVALRNEIIQVKEDDTWMH